MHRLRRTAIALLALLALSAFSCGGQTSPGGSAATSGRSVGSDTAAAQVPKVLALRASEEDLARLREDGFLRFAEGRLGPNLKLVTGSRAEGDAVLVFDPAPVAAGARELARGLPVEWPGDWPGEASDGARAKAKRAGLTFDGTPYEPGEDALALRIPRDGAIVWLVTGGAEGDGALRLAGEIFFRLAAELDPTHARGRRGRPLEADYLLRPSPYLERSGRWVRAADGSYGVDRAAERNDLAARDRAVAEARPLGGANVVLLLPPDTPPEPRWTELAAGLDRAAGEMKGRIGTAPEKAAPLRILLETDHVSQGRNTGQVGEAVPGGPADLHLVFDPRDGFAYRFALAERLLGRTPLAERLPPWLRRGAALWLSGDWYGRPYRDWLPRLAAAGVLPEARELLAPEDGERDGSIPLWAPVAAAVFERLPGRTVAEKVGHLPDESRLARLLAEIARSEAKPQPAPSHPLPPGFLHGVSLAMMNSLEQGYHAPALAVQLDALQRLGADAVSLMPFAFQPDPASPGLSFVARSPSGETDMGMIFATRLARARGLHVLYKPHVWVGHDAWSGEIEMKSEGDWARWFRAYRLYAVHHALLAGWAGADLYSLGCELSKTTPREAEWRFLIRAVRQVYPGAVTYSANWYGDLEGVRFWKELDAVGVDAYFPLAATPAASADELARGAREVGARLAAAARRTGRPVLLTEVGYAARKAAWIAPHTEGGEYSEEDQARAYQALFHALGHPDWLAGTFVWKAFSAPGGDAGMNADFRFLGRKAEAEIREYYRGR